MAEKKPAAKAKTKTRRSSKSRRLRKPVPAVRAERTRRLLLYIAYLANKAARDLAKTTRRRRGASDHLPVGGFLFPVSPEVGPDPSDTGDDDEEEEEEEEQEEGEGEGEEEGGN